MQEWNVEVQVLVVELVDDFRADDCAQLFQVDHKARFGTRNTFDGNKNIVIVSMPVFVAAFTEHLFIFLITPVLTPQFVGGIEVFFSDDVNCFHLGSFKGTKIATKIEDHLIRLMEHGNLYYLCPKIRKMIVVTGAAGFIGSCLVGRLNAAGFQNIIAVDDFSKTEKAPNLEGKKIQLQVERTALQAWLLENAGSVDMIFHIGARTDTTEFDKAIFDELNVNYSKMLWDICSAARIPLVYASSAATYGLGEHGYDDNHDTIPKLKPLNPYGDSKNDFDLWALQQPQQPPFWAGLKFFNVYGPNEYHKGRMASVIFHAFHQISTKGSMKLFRSHNPEYTDGGQLRDFVYVKDVVEICLFLMEAQPTSGIYNLGSGIARTFLDLATNTFHAMDKTPEIGFIDTPIDIRDKYQYFTEANMQKMRNAGFSKPFHTLEEGVSDYVKNYLIPQKYY